MKKKTDLVFFISGIMFMLILAAINYFVGNDNTFVGLMISFLFGGVVGLLAITEKDTYWKNIVFIAAFTWLIWALLSPIDVVGNNWVIKSNSLLAVVAVFIIFIEKEFWSIFDRMRNKKPKFAIGVLGIIAILIFLQNSGLGEKLWDLASKYIYVFIALLLAWWIYLYVIINKGLKNLGGKIVGVLKKK